MSEEEVILWTMLGCELLIAIPLLLWTYFKVDVTPISEAHDLHVSMYGGIRIVFNKERAYNSPEWLEKQRKLAEDLELFAKELDKSRSKL